MIKDLIKNYFILKDWLSNQMIKLIIYNKLVKPTYKLKCTYY